MDDTILEVPLDEPVLPGEVARLELDFETHVGRASYRMKENHGQYVITQWYPRICVYDEHGGWHVDQHLGHEFYGEFGTYDVQITLPAEYVVGATGVLVNRPEVLPDSLMAELDIRNFTSGSHPKTQAPGQRHAEKRTKTWIFHAENVHDFAWTADPTFRIGVAHWQHVTVYALARERKAAKWQDAAQVGAEVIAFYSKHIGRYPYPTMTIADVDEGMEYPMIVMCGGESPSYRYLFYHEIGHNWFYGVVANNETRNPHMDEGFTQLLHTMAMDSLIPDFGNRDAYRWKGWYARRFFPKQNDRLYRQFLYLQHAKIGYEQKVDTHSDKTLERAMYRLVAYNKPTTVLYALQYTLGRRVFQRVLQTYFHDWKFRHPYPRDFQRVAEKVSGWDLDWFFDQWWETTWTCDYGIRRVRNRPAPSGGTDVAITLERKGLAVMPLDLRLTLADGSVRRVIVPINRFHKPAKGALVTAPWDGWFRLDPAKTVRLHLPSPVRKVELDPSLRLPDTNRLDNVWPRHPFPIRVRFDNMFVTAPDLDSYDLWLRPSLMINSVDGLRIGLHADGSYLESPFSADKKLLAGVHAGVKSRSVQYSLLFRTPWRTFGGLANFVLRSARLAGREVHSVGLEATYRKLLQYPPWTQVHLIVQSSKLYDPAYLAVPWEPGRDYTLRASAVRGWRWRTVNQTLSVRLTTSLLRSAHQYTVVSAEYLAHGPLGRSGEVTLRLFGGRAQNTTPAQERFFLAGASPVQEYTNPLYRSAGTLPQRWRREGHVLLSGGANLRGYGPQNRSGTRAAAASLTLGHRKPLDLLVRALPVVSSFVQPQQAYFFADAGDVWTEETRFRLEADAGVGLALGLGFVPPRLGRWTLHLDFPAYVRRPVAGEKSVAFRWVVRVETRAGNL